MKIIIKLMLIMYFLILNMHTINAEETGNKLHDSKCLACHSTSVYTRSDRKVNSLDVLARRVHMCAKGAAKANWNKKQIDSVTDYLNNRFYLF